MRRDSDVLAEAAKDRFDQLAEETRTSITSGAAAMLYVMALVYSAGG
jgi:hypothetical protein